MYKTTNVAGGSSTRTVTVVFLQHEPLSLPMPASAAAVEV